MANLIKLVIVTPQRILLEKEVEAVVVQGSEGEMGILLDHTPLVTRLKIGVLKLRLDHNTVYPVSISGGGFLEVKPEKITVLADNAELPEEIDEQRAREAKERAERRLRRGENEKIDFARAQAALQRALARLNTISADRLN